MELGFSLPAGSVKLLFVKVKGILDLVPMLAHAKTG